MLKALTISKLLLVSSMLMLLSQRADAATFGIINATEANLRSAINNANSNGAGLDTITFFNQGTITLNSALPSITSALLIQGVGARLTIIEADDSAGVAGFRVFDISSAVTVTLQDMTIRNGHITAGNGAGVRAVGGDLYVNDCLFIDNQAAGTSNTGGAIDATGNLYVKRSSFVDNTHSRNGGAVGWHPSGGKTAEFTNVTFSGNTCGASQVNHGGGAFSSYSFSGTNTQKFVNCTFRDNDITGTSTNNGNSIFVAAIGATMNLTLLNTLLSDGTSGNYDTYTQSGGSVSLTRTYTVATDASMPVTGAGNSNSASGLGVDTLGYYGSQTLLYAISDTSSLVDAGTDSGAPDEDQRSVPKSGTKDIGAYEYFEQACDTPSFPTTYIRNYASRRFTYTNVDIASQGNVAFVNPGQNVTITFNYSITQDGSYCPGCIVQMYWGIRGYYGICERSFGGYCNCNGSVNRTFTAPTQAGIYYFTTGGSLQFSCQANPENRVSASSAAAFGAIIVGTPVNGSRISITGQSESCFSGGDTLYTDEVVGYTCTGVNLNLYQWFKDSVAIPSSNVSELPISEEGVYHVRWYNNINESVYSDTFKVNSLIRDFSSPDPIGLNIVTDTLTGLTDSAIVQIIGSQPGAAYVVQDTATGEALTDTLNGNGDTLEFKFQAKDAVSYGFWGSRLGCAKSLDTSFSFVFDDPRPYAGLGNAVTFDGINDELRIQSDSDFYFSGGEMSISFWLKRDDVNANRVVLGRWTGTPYHFVFGFKYDGAADGQFRLSTSSGYQNVFFTSGNVTGEWEHWTITAKAASAINIYKNGKLIKTQTITGTFNQTGSSHTVLGGMSNNTKWFKGSMDEVSFWKKELSLQELRKVMAMEVDTADGDLVAYYPMNHVAGTDTAIDISGNNHDAGAANSDLTAIWGQAADTFNYKSREFLNENDTIIKLAGYDAEGDSLVYELISGNENGAFDLLADGYLSLNKRFLFDHEYDSNLTVTYRVSDQIFYDTASIKLELQDENDPPSAGFDKALEFDGVDDFIDLTGNTAVDLTDSLTFEAWIYAENTTGRIFHNGGNNLLPGWTIFFIGSNLRVEMRNGSVVQADHNWTPYLNEWHHLAVNWNRTSGQLRVYVDGTLQVTRFFSVNIGNYGGEPALGGQSNGANLFDGKMDEVRIWDAYRPIAQIQEDMFTTVDPSSKGLAAYFNFDADGIGYDASDNRNHGVPKGFTSSSQILSIDTTEWSVTESIASGVKLAQGGGFDIDENDSISFSLIDPSSLFQINPGSGIIISNQSLDYETDSVHYISYSVNDNDSLSDTATIKLNVINEQEQVVAAFGEGFDFNGSGYIALPDTGRYFNAITVEAWIKPRAKSNINTIVACKASGAAAGWGFYSNTWLSGDRRLLLETSNGSVSTTDPVIALNEWQHVAFTISGGTAVKLYRNGQEVASGNLAAQLTNSGLRRIGAFNDNSYNAVGTFDEVRIWSVARTQAEIAANYRSRIDTSEANLRAYYDFNQFDTDFTLKDRSSNAFDGSLNFLTGNEWTSEGGDTLEYQISEAAAIGDSIGTALAYDPDNSPLTFSAIGGDITLFDLNDSTGLLTVGAASNFDYESGDTIFYLTYEVEEAGDLTRDSATMKIRITDGNDAPILSFGNALDFDGINDFATLGSGIVLANKSYTISFFSKLDQPYNTGRYNAWLGHGAIATRGGLHFLYENAVRIKHGFFNDDLIEGVTLDEKWHHLTFTYDVNSNERRTYIDGELLGIDTAGGDYIGTGTFYLGTEAWTTNYHDGLFDDFKVYDTVFTQSMVKADIGRSLYGTEPGLLTYHRFNEGTGTNLLDETGNHNGTFFNNANPWVGRDTIEYLVSETRPANDTIASLPGYDQDEGDTLSYLAISGDTAKIKLSSEGLLSYTGSLNYELDSVYLITAVVEDLEGLTDTAEVIIKIKDANEPPFFNTSPDTLIACAGSSTDSAVMSLLDYDIQDDLVNLNLTATSSDVSLIDSDSISISKGPDSLVYVTALTQAVTSSNNVSITLVATDHEGETDTVLIPVVIRAGMLINSDTIAAPLCAGDSNAYVAIDVQFGNSPFSYAWSNGSSNDTLLNAAAGSYTVSVTDNFGCKDSNIFTVVDPASLSASILTTINPSCFDYDDGFAVATATGGLSPYSYLWSDSLSQTSDTATGLADGAYTVTITDQYSCSDTATAILVEPAQVPASFNMSDDSICSGSQSTLTANAGTGFTYRWKRNASFIGGLASQVVNVDIGGVYSVEVTDSNNCFNLSSKDTLVINNLPAVSLSSLTNSCDQPGDSLLLNNGLPVGGTYSSTTAGAVTGSNFYPAIAGVGTHEISYSFTDANGCSASDTINVEVNAKPVASLSMTTSFCIGDTAELLNGGSANNGGTGSYFGTGVGSSYFDPNAAGAGSHTINYAFVDTNNCRDTASISVTVNAKPVLSFTSLADLCLDAGPLSLSGASATPTGGTGSYSGNGVFGSSFYPDSVGVGQHFVLYTYTDPNSCTDSISQSIRVNALPQVSMSTDSFCAIPGSSFGLNLGSPTGGTYSGTGISLGTNFDPGSVGAGQYSISYTYTDNNGCSNSDSTDLVVNGLPTVGFSSAYSAVCASEDTVDISSGTPATGGTGTYSGNGVIGTDLITALAGSGSTSITYTFTDNNGCVDSASQAIQVNALPNVSLPALGAYCEDTGLIALSSGTPVGGTYSGVGVTGSNFDPTSASLGSNLVTYSFTDVNGCTDSASNNIVINALPSVSLNLPVPTACENDTALNLSGGNPSFGVYSGIGVSGGNFDPSSAGTGTHVISYSFTDNNGCSDLAIDSIVVNSKPTISLSSFNDICENADPLTLTQGGAFGSGTETYSGPGVNSGVFDPSSAGIGLHTITYSFTDANTGCTSTDSGFIRVRAKPLVSLNMPDLYCINAGPQVLNAGSPGNGVYSGPGVFGDTLRPFFAGNGLKTYKYEFTNSFGCTDSALDLVTIQELPRIAPTSVDPLCEYEDPINLSPDTVYGQGSYFYSGTGVFNDTIFDPSVAQLGLNTIRYSFRDTNQCRRDTLFSIQVNATPTVSFSNLPAVCENNSPFILFQGISQGTGGKGWYSGPGVLSDSSTFEADSAGAGTHTISYYYLDRNNCIDSTSQTIQVDTVPVPFFTTGIPDFCAGNSPYPLTEGSPVPTNTGERSFYSGVGVLNGIFYPQYVTPGNTYDITYSFTDANGCSGDTVATVAVNNLPQLSAGFIPTRCDNEGIDTLNFANIQSAGISKTYYTGVGIDSTDSLSFDPSVAGQGNHLITFHLSDTNGCSASTQSYVTVYASSQVFLSDFNSVCEQASTITLTGGVPLGGSYSGKGVSNGRFNPAVADTGTHNIRYTYTNIFGCQDSAIKAIRVNPSPSLSLNLPNSFCERNTPYDLNAGIPAGGNYSGLGVFNNKFYSSITSRGNFTINYSYTDTNSCSASVSQTVQVVGNPNVTSTPDTLICNGSRVRLRASGGVTYRWSTGSNASSILVRPDQNETYRVTVTDANGCFDDRDIKVLVSPEITLSSTTKDAECGRPTGSGSVQASGGVSPFGFVWSNGSIGDVQTNLRAGLYQVTVTDANRCDALTTVAISDAGGASIVLDSLRSPSCPDTDDGFIRVNVSGGTSPTNLEWSNGASTNSISGLASGNYLLSVRDGENCLSFESFQLEEPEEILIDLSSEDANCGNSDGWAKAEVLAISPVSYQWSNSSSSDSIGALSFGVYQLTVQDGNSCSDSAEVIISESGGPQIVIDTLNNTQCGENDGKISLSLTDTSNTYLWSTGDTGSSISKLSPGKYHVTVSNAVGCNSIGAAEILSIRPELPEICMLSVDTATDQIQMLFASDTTQAISRYIAFREDVSGTNLFQSGDAPAGSNIIVDTSLGIISAPWTYVLQTEDSCGNYSDISESHRIIYTTAIPLPSGPVKVNWTAYEGFEPVRYNVYRSTDRGAFQLVNVAGPFQTTYFDASYSKSSSSLRYLVSAESPEICEGQSLSFSNKSLNVWSLNTGTNNLNIDQHLSLFPNPSSGLVKLRYNGLDGSLAIKITSATGQLVYQESIETDGAGVEELDLRDLASGLYQVQVTGRNGMSTIKLQLTK